MIEEGFYGNYVNASPVEKVWTHHSSSSTWHLRNSSKEVHRSSTVSHIVACWKWKTGNLYCCSMTVTASGSMIIQLIKTVRFSHRWRSLVTLVQQQRKASRSSALAKLKLSAAGRWEAWQWPLLIAPSVPTQALCWTHFLHRCTTHWQVSWKLSVNDIAAITLDRAQQTWPSYRTGHTGPLCS